MRFPPPPARREAGAALLTVLSVLVAMGVAVTLLFQRMRGDLRPWANEAEEAQALYLAESGIGYQLYLERWSDSSEPSFGEPPERDSSAAEGGLGFGEPLGALPRASPTDSFAFRMDSSLGTPRVKVDRGRSFLEMSATGKYRGAEVTLKARFGKALDDSIFGPAPTLDNDVPLEPFPAGQIKGTSRIRSPSPGMATLRPMQGFSVTEYAASFTDRKYYEAEEGLRKRLSGPDAGKGNATFTPREPPRFGKKGWVAFALGQVTLENDGSEAWVLKGPGKIYSEGEIRVKGAIRLEGIQLFSGKDITFEGEVAGEDVSAFARGSVFLHDRCRHGLEAIAVKDIVLRDKAQTLAGSVLLSTGSKGNAKGGADTLNVIRVVNEAVARGFAIAAGANGRVALATPANRVEGVVIASSVWLAGEVDGAVLARKLLCEGTNARNCLGTGRIFRDRLPEGFVQPLQLGPQDRRAFAFQLLDWERD